MTDPLEPRAIGTPLARLDAHAKVTGTAPFAFEHPVTDPLYLNPTQATVGRGRVTAIDTAAAEGLNGVVAVITHENAPRLASNEDKELWVLQSDEVAFRGQFIGAVVAETPEIARHAAGLVQVKYAEQPHDVELRASRDDLYAPDRRLWGVVATRSSTVLMDDAVDHNLPSFTRLHSVLGARSGVRLTEDLSRRWARTSPPDPYSPAFPAANERRRARI